MQTRLVFFLMLISVSYFNSFAANAQELKQDSITITLPEAEKRFVEQSLSVIAAHYDVTVANEGVLDAKLWYNPQLTYSQGLYDPQTKKYFDNSATGQFDVQLSQLFSIAGRHTNTVKLAKLNAQKSELQFKDVVRSLKLELYKDYETIYADEQKVKLYEYETDHLNKLLEGEKQQLQLGAVSQNEVIRLTAEIQQLTNSSVQNYNELLDAQHDLKTLLNYNEKVFLVAAPVADVAGQLPSMDAVITTAEQNRPDYLLSKTEVEYEKQNIRLQRSLGVPDMNLTVEHDQASSYVRDYNGIGISFPLPVFNRNQHQVRIAKAQYNKAIAEDSIQTYSLHNEVGQAYASYININKRFGSVSGDFSNQLDQLNQNALSNYSKRFINLIDFLDQVRTYTQSAINLIDLKHQFHDAVNSLNYVTGTVIIK